jgi:polysaccharide biosynthesis/export protein
MHFNKTPLVSTSDQGISRRTLLRHVITAGVLSLLAITTGCQIESSSAAGTQKEATQQKSESLILREGDVVKISIPSAPNLDAVQTIRRDGKIALALVGEVQAAGLKPSELQAELIRRYAPQLVSKEVMVSVVTSNFSTFVSGSVLRPGKITTDRPLTILEAIMEAGGPDFAKANLKAVTVIRTDESGRTQNFTINVKNMMDGRDKEPFFLKPSDIVIVPERFVVF